MNAGSGLNKWAPVNSVDCTFREIKNAESLAYISIALGAVDPVKITHLRFRVNLGATDATFEFTNSLKRVFKALKTYPHLQHLDMAHCQITDYTCRNHLMPMLECNSSIISLKLGNNAFSDEGTKGIFSALSLNTKSSVNNLDLSRNDFSYESMEVAGRCIGGDIFTVLDLSFSRVGAEGIRLLKPALSSVKKLTSLQLEGIQMGDEGCLELSTVILEKGLEKVDNLNLAQNNIGRVGIEKLCSNFYPEKNSTVTALDISRNYFGDEGFGFVTDMMWRNSSLKTLKVNKCGITVTKFNSFCEKLTTRYKQSFGPYPELEVLEVGYNGLGDNRKGTLFSMLKQPNCTITTIGYESNELTNFGAKLWKEFLVSFKGVRTNAPAFDQVLSENLPPEQTQEESKIRARRKDFAKLLFKGNAIDADGAETLADLVKANTTLCELDLRRNPIGVKGAIFFKKAFRQRMSNMQYYGWQTFRFNILVEDVTMEGINHLAIGIRESPLFLKRFIKTKENNHIHKYNRCAELQAVWNRAGADPNAKYLRDKVEQKIPADSGDEGENGNESKESVTVKLAKLNLERRNQNKLHLKQVDGKNKEFGNQLYQGRLISTRFSEFDTPSPSPANLKVSSEYKRPVILVGENDEKEDTLWLLSFCTYTSLGLFEDARGLVKWHPFLWSWVKEGWGSATVGNTLYRFGVLLRLQYVCEDLSYIRDLYLQRFCGLTNEKEMKNLLKMNYEDLVSKMVTYDIQKLWETLNPQTTAYSQGLTMFEHVLKFSASPVVDCVRQFLNIFPANEYKTPFLEQSIAGSGETFRSLCKKSEDRFVKRYAEAKKLILFRFLEIEPVYNSRFVKVSKVEDLLLTEEYNDDERFFFMRRIAPSTAQSDEHLAQNEFNAHLSLMNTNGKYLSNSKSYEKVENWILQNKNPELDVEHMPMISPLFNRKQFLSMDRLAPTFTVCYSRTLRDVLDTECLAGGRDLDRSQLTLRMIANGLFHLNDRVWSQTWSKDDGVFENKEQLALIGLSRIHGNVKPRNIVQRCAAELPDLDKGIDLLPEKWVLCDFTRSTPHGEEYFAAPNSGYNPPEVAKRQLSSDSHYKQKEISNQKIDVWQFGCVLFEILSGTTLFKLEARDDTILFEDERAELVNWVSLDKERSDLILNQLATYSSNTYDEAELKQIVESGKQLCEMCLQGRPEDRPSLHEILNHPFLLKVNTGKKKYEKEMDDILNKVSEKSQGGAVAQFFKTKVYPVPSIQTGWDNWKFLQHQPHVHLINTGFEQAGLIVKALEGTLASHGCVLTTDSLDFETSSQHTADAAVYDELLRKNVQAARVIACFLTRDAFYKPNVIKQLLFAEDFRKKDEKVFGRVLFIDVSAAVNLSKDNLTWDKESFRNSWTMSDEFQYLVKALALQNPSFSSFSLHNTSYDDQFDAWNKFLTNEVRGMILSYIQEPIKYHSPSFLTDPMLDKMLLDGHLVPTRKVNSYDIPKLTKSNFKDPVDTLNMKLKERKGKFMNLYFLPAHKERHGAARVYVLCVKSMADEMIQAVSQIAQALEAPNMSQKVKGEDLHKDKLDPRNKVVNKVKTSYTIRKESHLKIGGRENKLQTIKDSVLNVKRSEGKLVLVFLCTPGVFKTYKKFLADVAEKRDKNDIVLLLVAGIGWKAGSPEAEKEIKENVPKQFWDAMCDKDEYLPYFKPKKDPWQFDAVSSTLASRAVLKMDRPAVVDSFSELLPAKTGEAEETSKQKALFA